MRTFFFGDVDKQLYGVYHAPAGAVRERAVLMCYPVGYEYIYAHRVFRQLAGRLSAAGLHVLRFDYYGTGDSAGNGDDNTVGQWLEDVRMAAAELRELSGIRDISVVGLRAGAPLAAEALADAGELRDLVFWDPVVDGARYKADLDALHRGFVAASPPLRRGGGGRRNGQWLGFPSPPALQREIAALDLLRDEYGARRVVLLTSTDARLPHGALRHLERNGRGFEHHPVGGTGRWYAETDEPYALRLQEAALPVVVDVLAAGRP